MGRYRPQSVDGPVTSRPSLPDHEWIASWSNRGAIRLVLLSEVISGPPIVSGTPAADLLDFGRLAPHVSHHSDVLPICSQQIGIPLHNATWSRAQGRVQVSLFSKSLWSIPGSDSTFLVQIVDLPVDTSLANLVRCLEDMYFGDLTDAETGIAGFPDRAPHRSRSTHQLVIFPDDSDRGDLTDDQIQRLLYRADLPARLEYTKICRPDELNRRDGRGAACGPFVTVLWGQQDYIENLAFLSAMMATTAASVIRDARSDLLSEIASMDSIFGASSVDAPAPPSISDARSAIVLANRVVARTENRIATCVDGFSTLQPFVPGLRSESYHRALFAALDAERNRETLERMLGRIKEMIRVEQEQLAAAIDLNSEDRSLRWTISLGAASVVTVPFGLIFGFFGVTARQVDPTRSMFDRGYLPIYLVVGVSAAAILVVHLVLLRLHAQRSRR